MTEIAKKTVLFLCTGNYYRSRFAEHVFNHVAASEGLPWLADSRGLDVKEGYNPGPMSRSALRTLQQLGVMLPPPLRFPLPVNADDFQRAALIVALKEAEHRPLLEERFPAWTEHVQFWHVHDLDVATPEEALPLIRKEVLDLVARLRSADIAGT
jgi:protein-tyrosine phosphatase